MRVFKGFTLDIELVQKLQEEDNASELVNQLLTQHYNYKAKDTMSREERKAYLLKQREILLAEKKLKEMRNAGQNH